MQGSDFGREAKLFILQEYVSRERISEPLAGNSNVVLPTEFEQAVCTRRAATRQVFFGRFK
jgi:hypothetical protein